MTKQKQTQPEPIPDAPTEHDEMVADDEGFTFGVKPLPEDDPAPAVQEAAPAVEATVPDVEWCKFCQAPRLVDTKNAHWCGQCRREPLKK